MYIFIFYQVDQVSRCIKVQSLGTEKAIQKNRIQGI